MAATADVSGDKYMDGFTLYKRGGVYWAYFHGMRLRISTKERTKKKARDAAGMIDVTAKLLEAKEKNEGMEDKRKLRDMCIDGFKASMRKYGRLFGIPIVDLFDKKEFRKQYRGDVVLCGDLGEIAWKHFVKWCCYRGIFDLCDLKALDVAFFIKSFLDFDDRRVGELCGNALLWALLRGGGEHSMLSYGRLSKECEDMASYGDDWLKRFAEKIANTQLIELEPMG